MKRIKKILLIVFSIFGVIFIYFFVGITTPRQDVAWGVNFSQKHTEALGLDWRKTYTALLDDLEVRRFKIAVHWDIVEPNEREFDFVDLDWQMAEARKRDAKALLVVGMKTPRWPECHIPGWAADLSKEQQQQEISLMLETIVSRYKDSPALLAWQVENEPFFSFGVCPWLDDEFLEKEVELVRSLDTNHPIIISDTGEFSFWTKPARIADTVGVTLYRKAWFKEFSRYVSYPLNPVFYARKAALINLFFDKEVIGVELQAEPWGPALLYDLPREEQVKTMNLEQFKKNIDFARRTGFKEFYLWGAEWWFWMKEVQNDPAIWNEAKSLDFSKNL